MNDWLELQRGEAPLLVCFAHTGTELPVELAGRFASPWLARKDADPWVHLLYSFAAELGATTVRTRISRSVIDVNRDPSGASLYPGQNTTELCPTTTFDGEALYAPGDEPTPVEIAARARQFFAPYHALVSSELARLHARHARVVLFDAHAIRSRVPRLFDGLLPELNLGTNDGATCSQELQHAVARVCAGSGFSHVSNGRFKGGWTTRHYGRPAQDQHALQLELACRSYMREPTPPLSAANWPAPYEPAHAARLRAVLAEILSTCLAFARSPHSATEQQP